MKPAVINNSSETPTQTHHEANMTGSNQGNNGQNEHSRRFPQFRQHGFGFDGPDGDVFSDMGLRSRLNRMGNPFDWKRRTNGQGTGAGDPYDRYFDDVDFPHFGSTWDAFGRMGKRSQQPHESNDRSGFFDYIPAEFRQHVPEHFGGYFRQHSGQPYMHQQQHHQQQQQPSQQQQQPQQQQSQSSQPSGSKSNLCDAAIQTDDPNIPCNGGRQDVPNTNQNDKRNGVNVNQNSSASTQVTGDVPVNKPNQYYQENPNYGASPHQGQQYGRQHYQQPYGQYQYSQSPNQNQYYANSHQQQPQPQQQQQQQQPKPQPQQQKQQQPHQQHASQDGYVRTVPIHFEDGTPINAPSQSTSQTASNKPRPEPLNKESFASNQPIPCPPPPSHNQQQTEQQHSDSSDAGSAPPQTPHTADCISKIQAIQRDVLELMLAVEQFGGKRGDKDYMYLDEMLTRNLLKLDTIDTNGKDSIRMARKEAIKCIQTSIAVLEAKADLHLNETRDGVDQTNQDTTMINNSEVPSPSASSSAAPSDEKPAENTKTEPTKDNIQNSTEHNNATDSNGIDISKVENISINEKNDDDTEKSSEIDKPVHSKEKNIKEKKKEKTPESAV